MDVNSLDENQFHEYIDTLGDEDLHAIAQRAVPWSSSTRINDEVIDADGFPLWKNADELIQNFSDLQMLCWRKFTSNPQINSHVRDFMGSLTGYGFGYYSHIESIQNVMEEIAEDPRNELHKNMSKYVARSEIQGELFLCLTLHTDGFVEIDFIEPTLIPSDGIIKHPRKKTMPLLYKMIGSDNKEMVIPSIYAAYYPELLNEVKDSYNKKDMPKPSAGSAKFRELGGYNRFIIAWDRGFLTDRNVSHIRTTLEWIEYYESLKKWEIDHKKSSGSYLWVASMEDTKAFRTWLKMSDDDRRSTGLTAKKTPGGTLILPPGIKLECINPKLSSISDQDTDIMSMVTSGLNRPEDMVTGKSSGSTFSGVNASRGPQSDRIQDEIAYFERFLIFDFWRSIFFLRSKMDRSFKLEYVVNEVTSFANQKPKTKKVKKAIHKLITVNFPTSEVTNLEGKAKAYLGVKHPSIVETLGIPRSEVAKKLGFGSYIRNRLQYATEEETLPDLPTTYELDAAQESVQEPSKPKGTEKTGNNDKGNAEK